MLVPRVGVVGAADLTVHVVGAAAFHLDLHRCVVDPEFAVQLRNHGPQDLLTRGDRLFVDENVTTAGDHSRADGPDVEVVDVEDAVDGSDSFFDGRHVD